MGITEPSQRPPTPSQTGPGRPADTARSHRRGARATVARARDVGRPRTARRSRAGDRRGPRRRPREIRDAPTTRGSRFTTRTTSNRHATRAARNRTPRTAAAQRHLHDSNSGTTDPPASISPTTTTSPAATTTTTTTTTIEPPRTTTPTKSSSTRQTAPDLLQYSGALTYPEDVATSIPFSSADGIAAARVTWSGGAELVASLRCRGAHDSRARDTRHLDLNRRMARSLRRRCRARGGGSCEGRVRDHGPLPHREWLSVAKSTGHRRSTITEGVTALAKSLILLVGVPLALAATLVGLAAPGASAQHVRDQFACGVVSRRDRFRRPRLGVRERQPPARDHRRAEERRDAGVELVDTLGDCNRRARRHRDRVPCIPSRLARRERRARWQQLRPRPPHGRLAITSAVAGECLPELAERVSGCADDWPEIAALNFGVLQPDGARMLDPARLRGGWRLRVSSHALPLTRIIDACSIRRGGASFGTCAHRTRGRDRLRARSACPHPAATRQCHPQWR